MKCPDNAVIRSVPAAAELRKVTGFNPLKFIRRTTSQITGEKVLKLELPYKRLWFRLACPNGRMMVKPLRITDQIAVFEAMVFAEKNDTEPLARFTSSVSAGDVKDGQYISAAKDTALNEALENAGFGIQLCDLVEGAGDSRYGSEIPLAQVSAAHSQKTVFQSVPEPQAPEPTPTALTVGTEQTQVKNLYGEKVDKAQEIPPAGETEDTLAHMPEAIETEVVSSEVRTKEPETATEPLSAILTPSIREMSNDTPENATTLQRAAETHREANEKTLAATTENTPTLAQYTPDMTVEEIKERMTLEEARAFVVDFGFCKGWTLAQVAEERAPSLRFYVCSNRASNVQKAAAWLLMDEIELNKAG